MERRRPVPRDVLTEQFHIALGIGRRDRQAAACDHDRKQLAAHRVEHHRGLPDADIRRGQFQGIGDPAADIGQARMPDQNRFGRAARARRRNGIGRVIERREGGSGMLTAARGQGFERARFMLRGDLFADDQRRFQRIENRGAIGGRGVGIDRRPDHGGAHDADQADVKLDPARQAGGDPRLGRYSADRQSRGQGVGPHRQLAIGQLRFPVAERHRLRLFPGLVPDQVDDRPVEIFGPDPAADDPATAVLLGDAGTGERRQFLAEQRQQIPGECRADPGGVVFDLELDRFDALGHEQRHRDLRFADAQPFELDRDIADPDAFIGRVLQDEERLDRRVFMLMPLQMQPVDDFIERGFLIVLELDHERLIVRQLHFRRAIEHVMCGKEDGVGEEADHFGDVGISPIGHHGAEKEVVLAAHQAERALEGREQHCGKQHFAASHEFSQQARVGRPGEPAQVVGRSAPRGRGADRKIQRRQAGDPIDPEMHLFGRRRLALKLREVGELQGKRRERAGIARPEQLIGFAEIAGEDRM
ncbi:hypothetical protein NDN01_19845 [Sphingomonas sp. QA11]|nr:hypothetical protein [Sphingomonas sp. QA11]WCM26236.1 hypothetical protein NDN01_19845 [Sphingomonas sp. QA11]